MNAAKVLTALVPVLVLSTTGRTEAQTTRSFQTGLYAAPTVSGVVPTNADIAMFNEGDDGGPQPAGLSILRITTWSTATPLSVDQYPQFDFSRIVAGLVDEPYGSIDNELVGAPTCSAPTATIATISAELQTTAAALKARNPRARFWVNFTSQEANWMSSCSTQTFNQTYIDVVSEDDYNVDFGGNPEAFYANILTAPATDYQQVALVPGVFSTPTDQLSYLQGYFDYANSENQACNLPLGPRGLTGSFDGCPVWIVLGYPANNSGGYTGPVDSNSDVATAWHQEIALPLSPNLAHQLPPGWSIPFQLPLMD
jgi:hypothetical protein